MLELEVILLCLTSNVFGEKTIADFKGCEKFRESEDLSDYVLQAARAVYGPIDSVSET